MSRAQIQLKLNPPLRRIEKYRPTKADARIRRAVKQGRGLICESCKAAFPAQQLAIHHIFETRIYPELAREPLNMIVLCPHCHSRITWGEGYSTSLALHFYAELSSDVRLRHIPFLVSQSRTPEALLAAFRSGNKEYWNSQAVRDLTR